MSKAPIGTHCLLLGSASANGSALVSSEAGVGPYFESIGCENT